MDNAQKAIMIGVGLFITIIIISAVLLITNLGTDLVNNARAKLANISTALQNQVLQAFDGEVMSGTEVLSAVQQYQNDEISIMIVAGTASESIFRTGKYEFTVGDNAEHYTQTLAGGIKTTNDEYKELGSEGAAAKIALSDMQGTKGVSATQSYRSYVVKDQHTDTVMGILFVRVGLKTGETEGWVQ